jgi:hypothetical protein
MALAMTDFFDRVRFHLNFCRFSRAAYSHQVIRVNITSRYCTCQEIFQWFQWVRCIYTFFVGWFLAYYPQTHPGRSKPVLDSSGVSGVNRTFYSNRNVRFRIASHNNCISPQTPRTQFFEILIRQGFWLCLGSMSGVCLGSKLAGVSNDKRDFLQHLLLFTCFFGLTN